MFANLLILAGLAAAQVSTSALALVDAQYANSGFSTNSLAGFGLTLKSSVLVTVTYGFGVVQNGAAYSVAQVATMPTITVTPLTAPATGAKYTVMLADASSLGDPDVQGNYRHYLANSETSGTAAATANSTFTPSGGVVVTSYAAPGPITGTGPHRYAFLVFSQGSTFTPPANLSTAGTAPGHWNVSSYVSSTGISLIGASFFTVEVGTPTGSVAATQAVNTATLSTSMSMSMVGSSTSGVTAASSTSSSAAPASSTTKSSAEKVAISTFALILLGLAIM